MKILVVKWDCYMLHGVISTLEKCNVDYELFDFPLVSFEEDENFEMQLEQKILSSNPTKVFSINFLPVVSKVCEKKGVIYVSWSYDSPIKESAWTYLRNSCNEIYDFDRGQVEEFHKNGIKNAWHLPLASDIELFQGVINRSKNLKDYQADVSLVGKLYTSDYPIFLGALKDYGKGYVEECITAQKTITSGYLIPKLITPKIYEEIVRDLREKGITDNITRKQVEYVLAQEACRRNRVLALSLLSGYCQTKLYSTDHYENDNLIQMGSVHYENEMPLIFHESRINLNISFNAIQTGIPLRALDILGCGGFLMSNPQQELLENFKVGEECEIFYSIEELAEKTKYYLAHEEARSKIVQKGFEKVKKEYSFEERIKICFKLK